MKKNMVQTGPTSYMKRERWRATFTVPTGPRSYLHERGRWTAWCPQGSGQSWCSLLPLPWSCPTPDCCPPFYKPNGAQWGKPNTMFSKMKQNPACILILKLLQNEKWTNKLKYKYTTKLKYKYTQLKQTCDLVLVSEWVRDSGSEWMSMKLCVSEWVSEWVGEWVIEWVCEWVNE